MRSHHALLGGARLFFDRGRQTPLAQDHFGLSQIAVSLLERLLALHKACARLLTQLLHKLCTNLSHFFLIPFSFSAYARPLRRPGSSQSAPAGMSRCFAGLMSLMFADGRTGDFFRRFARRALARWHFGLIAGGEALRHKLLGILRIEILSEFFRSMLHGGLFFADDALGSKLLFAREGATLNDRIGYFRRKQPDCA